LAKDPTKSSQIIAFFRLIGIIVGSVWALSFFIVFYEADLQIKQCFHQAQDITGSEKARSQMLMSCEEIAERNTLSGRIQGVVQILYSNQPSSTKVYVFIMSLLPIKIR
jgi:hypothetical protein